MKQVMLLVVLLIALSVRADEGDLQVMTAENVNTLTEIGSNDFGDNVVWDMSFQPIGNTLAVILENGDDLFFLNASTLDEVSEATLSATAITFNSDGTLFAIGDWEGSISIFNANDYHLIENYPAVGFVVNDLAFSPDGLFLGATFGNPMLAGGGEDAFQLISVETGEILFSYPFGSGVYGGGVDFNETGDTVYFSATDTSINVENGIVYELDTSTMELITTEYETSPFSDDLIYSQGLIYIGEDSVYINHLSAEGDRETLQVGFEQENETITSISQLPDEPILAVGYSKRTPRSDGGPSVTNAGIIRLFHSDTGEELVSLDVPDGAIWSLAFSPDGTLLASGGADGTVRLWGIPAGE